MCCVPKLSAFLASFYFLLVSLSRLLFSWSAQIMHCAKINFPLVGWYQQEIIFIRPISQQTCTCPGIAQPGCTLVCVILVVESLERAWLNTILLPVLQDLGITSIYNYDKYHFWTHLETEYFILIFLVFSLKSVQIYLTTYICTSLQGGISMG